MPILTTPHTGRNFQLKIGNFFPILENITISRKLVNELELEGAGSS
jgi:hypothetical protein